MPGAFFPMAWMYINQGYYDEALEILESRCMSEQVDCSYFYEMIYTFTRQFDKAFPQLENLDPKITPDPPITPEDTLDHLFGYALTQKGYVDEGTEILNRMIKIFKKNQSYWQLSEAYAELGNKDSTVFYLKKTYDDNPILNMLEFTKHYPVFYFIHDDPDYKKIIGEYDQDKAVLRERIFNIAEHKDLIL